MHTDFLEEQLNLIHIQEDLKKFYPEKINNLIKKLKNVNQHNVYDLKKQLPQADSYNTIIAYAKKNPDLYSNYLKEKRKKSKLPEESKNIQDMTLASLKTLHQYAVKQNHPKARALKDLLDELQAYLLSTGIWLLTIGMLFKIAHYLADTFKIFAELFSDLQSSKKIDGPISTYFIIIGVCLLILSYGITKIRNRKKKKEDTLEYGKNPYEGEI